MARSTAAAGTIIQTARGFESLLRKSSSESAPVAPSFASAVTTSAEVSYTMHLCPPLMSRRTMLAPIRPRPIIPSSMANPPLARRRRVFLPGAGRQNRVYGKGGRFRNPVSGIEMP